MASIDHLVLGASRLEEGIAWVADLTGVVAELGGRHSRLGTHNAILSLGGRCYLEILAPDPTQRRVVPALESLRDVTQPRLFKWAVAVEPISAATVAYRAWPMPHVEPESGSRKRLNGGLVAWMQVGFLSNVRPDIPFAIEWIHDSVHPAHDAPAGCTLRDLAVQSPDPARLSTLFESLGLNVNPTFGNEPAVNAVLDTPRGEVNLIS